MCEDEGPLGFPAYAVYPLQICRQEHSEASSNCTRWRRIPTGQLGRQFLPETLPQGGVCNTPVKVSPIIVVDVVTIHPHQHLMGSGWVKLWEVSTLLHGGRMGLARYVCGLASTVPWCPSLLISAGHPLASCGAALSMSSYSLDGRLLPSHIVVVSRSC